MSATPHPEQLPQQAQAFWQAWLAVYPRLQTLTPREIVEESTDILQAHLPQIVFELEGSDEKAAHPFERATVVFSANGMVEHFAQVQAVCDAVPSDVPFAVRAFRGALPAIDQFRIGMDGFDLGTDDMLARLTIWREMPALEIAFAKPIDDEMLQHAQHMSFIMLDHILGEWASAVKLGAVDFVEAAEADFFPMAELPAKLHAMWLELGRNGVYPEPEWQYATAHVEEDEEHEQDALVLSRNQSANSLLGRADMGWVVSLACQIGSQEDLDDAYDLQDAFDMYATQQQQGINTLSMMNMTQGQRTVFAATSQAETLLEHAQKLCAQYAHLNPQVDCHYDPSWSHYRC